MDHARTHAHIHTHTHTRPRHPTNPKQMLTWRQAVLFFLFTGGLRPPDPGRPPKKCVHVTKQKFSRGARGRLLRGVWGGAPQATNKNIPPLLPSLGLPVTIFGILAFRHSMDDHNSASLIWNSCQILMEFPHPAAVRSIFIVRAQTKVDPVFFLAGVP